MTVIDRFVFLGAGASYGARLDDAFPPPLGMGLARYLREWLEANDPEQWTEIERITGIDARNTQLPPICKILQAGDRRERIMNWLREAEVLTAGDVTGFEIAMERLWEQRGDRFGARLLDDLNWLLAWALTTGRRLAFAEHADEYDRLFRCFANDSLAVISLNYDTLAEKAMCRVFGHDHFHYVGFSDHGRASSAPVFKLHGSCNFISIPSVQGSASFEVLAKSSVPPLTLGPEDTLDTQRQYAIRGSRGNIVQSLKHEHQRNARPVMALFMTGKPAPWNWPALAAVRDACQRALDKNRRAVANVIGIHMPAREDDDVSLGMVLKSLGQLTGGRTFVNPDPAQCAKAADYGFTAVKKGLSDFIDSC